ncbi:MmcQ/YjbR family DNA-binding protein [Phenylobacterium sp.]|uniref:MmcQ/YjbR family DNA-binding protein n=1 Tax=Phenylobacterium sp. TaxID=1871053 RepID=UPI0012135B67|nr:MmcQ/YjbR family DNA-binding protein [Phenylobacterium sp.]THD68675.1 MAG: MmcQ/YjbR family DNA-binding protein [Phenylobacterium sp.]
MATPAALRRIAMTFPEAYEDFHRRRPAFRVRNRIFTMLGVTGNGALFPDLAAEDIAVLKLDREDQLNMAAAYPDAVRPTETYGHHGWTYVRLPLIDEAVLATLLRLAWTHVAPKALVSRLIDEGV